MADAVTQEEVLEEQKKRCPFCQIIAGNIPSNKVYEDEKIIAILDINPAVKGHLLLVPKEHFPLLVMCPPDLFNHLIVKARDLSSCVEQGVLSHGSTMYVAGGAAAGQQSYHFMLHIIPRDDGDGLSVFELPHKTFPAEKLKEVKNALSKNLTVTLGRRFGKIQAPKVSKEQLLDLIERKPQLKQIIVEKPEEFKKAIPQNYQLKALFAEVNVDEIIAEVQGKAGNKTAKKEMTEVVPAQKEEKKETKDEPKKSLKKEKKKTTSGVDLDNIADVFG